MPPYDENIMPSLPSARNTYRKSKIGDFEPVNQGIIAVNSHKQKLYEADYGDQQARAKSHRKAIQQDLRAVEESKHRSNSSEFKDSPRLPPNYEEVKEPHIFGQTVEDATCALFSQRYQADQSYQAQQVNSFIPPTRAS